MNQSFASLVLAAGLLSFGTGCASIVSGELRRVSFNTEPAGAKVTITDPEGRLVTEGTTPFNTLLARGKPFFTPQHYHLSVCKEGYERTEQELKASLNGWYAGNLAMGSLVGILIVDPMTGAMWTLPKEVNVQLNPEPETAGRADSGAFPVADHFQGADEGMGPVISAR